MNGGVDRTKFSFLLSRYFTRNGRNVVDNSHHFLRCFLFLFVLGVTFLSFLSQLQMKNINISSGKKLFYFSEDFEGKIKMFDSETQIIPLEDPVLFF